MENQSRIEELLAESLRKSDRIADQLNDLTMRVDRLTVQVDRLTDRMDRVEAEIRELKEDVRDLKSDVSDLKSDVSDLKSDVKDLKGEVVKLNLVSAENSRALIKLADNAIRIERLEKAVFRK